MSTDTAFALGMLALVGPRFPDRLRAFMLTRRRRRRPRRARRDRDRLHRARSRGALLVAVGAVRAASSSSAPAACGAGSSTSLLGAGVVGGAARSRASTRSWSASRWASLAYAYPAARGDLERATDLFRRFREQPTPELARAARLGVRVRDLAERAPAAAVPPVDELRDRAAVRARQRGHRDRRRLPVARVRPRRSRSASSSATCVGKPIGIVGATWLVTRLSRGRLRPAGRVGGRRWAAARSPASASRCRC